MYFTVGGMKIKILADHVPEECDGCCFFENKGCRILDGKAFEGFEECPLEERAEEFEKEVKCLET